jgi:hypothetical protein
VAPSWVGADPDRVDACPTCGGAWASDFEDDRPIGMRGDRKPAAIIRGALPADRVYTPYAVAIACAREFASFCWEAATLD